MNCDIFAIICRIWAQ